MHSNWRLIKFEGATILAAKLTHVCKVDHLLTCVIVFHTTSLVNKNKSIHKLVKETPISWYV